MATKTVKLPALASLTGMYAFCYNPTTGALINTGGDVLALKAGSDANAGLFEFDLAESVTAYDWVDVRVHSSATASAANLLWFGVLEKGKDEAQDSVTPLADHYTKHLAGLAAAVVGAGAIANADTTTESFEFTYKGVTYNVTQTDGDATGNRATPTVSVT